MKYYRAIEQRIRHIEHGFGCLCCYQINDGEIKVEVLDTNTNEKEYLYVYVGYDVEYLPEFHLSKDSWFDYVTYIDKQDNEDDYQTEDVNSEIELEEPKDLEYYYWVTNSHGDFENKDVLSVANSEFGQFFLACERVVSATYGNEKYDYFEQSFE